MKECSMLHRLWKTGIGFLMAGMILAASFTPAIAAERTVRFNIPACMSWGGFKRVSSTLKTIKGVTSVERYGDQDVTVVYDDDKANVKRMMDLLKRRGYPVNGMPVFVQ